MVKILLKKQFTEIVRSYFYDAKKNKARSKAAITGYIVLFVILMVGILGGMFTFLSVSLCGALTAVGFACNTSRCLWQRFQYLFGALPRKG